MLRNVRIKKMGLVVPALVAAFLLAWPMLVDAAERRVGFGDYREPDFSRFCHGTRVCWRGSDALNAMKNDLARQRS